MPAKISAETFFTVTEQTRLFLLSVLLGAALGIVFDIFRAAKEIFPPLKKTLPTAVCDVLFFLICGFCIYLFSLIFARGEVRGYYWLGALLGGLIYLFTAGSIVIGIIRAVFRSIFAAFAKIGLFIGRIFTAFASQIRINFSVIFVKNAKKTISGNENNGKDLKSTPKSLYNIRGKSEGAEADIYAPPQHIPTEDHHPLTRKDGERHGRGRKKRKRAQSCQGCAEKGI